MLLLVLGFDPVNAEVAPIPYRVAQSQLPGGYSSLSVFHMT